MLVGGPLAKFYLAGLLTFECRNIKSLRRLAFVFNVVSEPLQVPMLPVLVHCLVALAPVAWNLRYLHQKGEMSCKIRVF